RYLIGDQAFFRALRRMAYPTKEMESWTDGRQTRLVNTDDFLNIAERESGMKLGGFFELYLRQPKLPMLETRVITSINPNKPSILELEWKTPNEMPFPMPLDVVADGKKQRVEMKNGKGSICFTGTAPVVDPNGWVLKETKR
ncbi:MAG: M1 family metallopeptidase, partial [Pyrinomonadaceae bacterium]